MELQGELEERQAFWGKALKKAGWPIFINFFRAFNLDCGSGMSYEKKDDKNMVMGRIGSRPFWVLNLSVVIRAFHQVGAAVFFTSFLFKESLSPPPMYLYLVFVSGFALFFTEWLRHRQVLREVSGIATTLKLVLLGAAYHHFLPMTGTVVLTFFVASICSHAPKTIRHRLMF